MLYATKASYQLDPVHRHHQMKASQQSLFCTHQSQGSLYYWIVEQTSCNLSVYSRAAVVRLFR
jgi:hypothetical protein